MNITQENIDELNAILKINVVADDYLLKVESALKEHQKKAAVPGFRQGKVPAGMIRKMYGKSILVNEVSKLLQDSLYQYLQENKIEVLGNPLPKADTQIDWDNQKEFEFLYEMGLAPKFNVELSANDKFVYKTVKIDEELVDKYINDVSKRYGKVEQVEESTAADLITGDFVELDEAGEILPGGLFKSGSVFMERVKDEATQKQLIGLKKEDKVVLNAQKIAETPAGLAALLGIDTAAAEKLASQLQFTVKSISRLLPAELNQELFNKIYGEGVVNSVEEFRAKIKEELAELFVNDSDRLFYNEIVDYLMNKVNFNLPNDFLKRWIMAANEKPVTIQQIEAEFDNYAKGLKWQLIENRIIKDNNIQVTKEEIVDHTKELIRQQYGKYSPIPMEEEELNKTVQRVLANEEEAKKLYEKLYGQKIMQLFRSTFSIENKEITHEDLLKSAR